MLRWKVVPASFASRFTKDLPVPGTSSNKELALLLVTMRKLQGEAGLGTVSDLIRHDDCGAFVLASFEAGELVATERLPAWFVGMAGARKREELLLRLLQAIKPSLPNIKEKILAFLGHSDCKDRVIMARELEKRCHKADLMLHEADFKRHLLEVHHAVDLIVALAATEPCSEQGYEARLEQLLES